MRLLSLLILLLILLVILLALLLRAAARSEALSSAWREFLRRVQEESAASEEASPRRDAPLWVRCWLPLLFILLFALYLAVLPRVFQASADVFPLFLAGSLAAVLLLMVSWSYLRKMKDGARKFALSLAIAFLLEGLLALDCVLLSEGYFFRNAITFKTLGGVVINLLFFLSSAYLAQQSFLNWRYPLKNNQSKSFTHEIES